MYFAGGCVLVIGVVLVLLGLTFIIGSKGSIGTAATGVLMLVIGVVGGILTIRKMGQLLGRTPDSIDERMLNLAGMSGGEVTVGEATGALMISVDEAQQSLDRLVGNGMAELKVRDETVYYVFAGIAEVRKVKKCAYCGNEYAVRDPRRTCPSCGGNLEVVDAGE
jgi:hypothetical protein